MLTIEGSLVRYDGRLWHVLEVSETSVHLILGQDGVCVECDDAELLAQLAELVG